MDYFYFKFLKTPKARKRLRQTQTPKTSQTPNWTYTRKGGVPVNRKKVRRTTKKTTKKRKRTITSERKKR